MPAPIGPPSSATGDAPVTSAGSAAGAPTGVPQLALPSEPSELRTRIRQQVLGGSGWLQSAGDDHGLGTWVWQHWGPILEPLGTGRTEFDAVVAGYRRELWFWVLGERTWEQAVGGLAGRMRRRLPSA